jgi:hypothetical protein
VVSVQAAWVSNQTVDRRRENFDRHAACVVVAFVAGG